VRRTVSTARPCGLLTSLVDKSLCSRRSSTRDALAVAETVRQYARDRLAKGVKRRRWRVGISTMCLALAKQAEARWTSENNRYGSSSSNRARQTCAGPWRGVARPAGIPSRPAACCSAGVFWRSRGHLGEGRRWLSVSIDAAPSVPDSATRADAFRWRSLGDGPSRLLAAQELQKQPWRSTGWRGIAWAPPGTEQLGLMAAEQANHSAAQLLFGRAGHAQGVGDQQESASD
jgi:hypothetical protein